MLGYLLSKVIIGRSYVSLSSNQIDNLVSDTLKNDQNGTYLPLNGIDYTLGETTSFNNGWIVVPIKNIKSQSSALVIIHDVKGKDYLILGPGSKFNSNQLKYLPSDVAIFLNK